MNTEDRRPCLRPRPREAPAADPVRRPGRRSGGRGPAGPRRAGRRRPRTGGRPGRRDAAAGRDYAGPPGHGGRRRPRPRACRSGRRAPGAGGGPLLGRRCPRHRAGGRRPRLGRPGRPGQRGGPAQQAYALYEELGSAEGTARVRARLRARGHPALPLDPHGPAGLRLGQPDRHRTHHHRPGGPGPQQPPGGQPGLPEHPHRRLSPAPRLLEARRHLARPARPHGRRANRRTSAANV